MKPPRGSIGQVLLWISYPVLIFGGLHFLQPRYVAGLLALLLILRRRRDAGELLRGLSLASRLSLAALVGLIALTILSNSELLLKLYPATVSFGLLLLFALSLRDPPSMIERFARLKTPDLPPEGVTYTRRVTQVWCAFLAFNGGVAVYTALLTSTRTWTLYNGLVSYVLVGLLIGGEWLVRRRVMPRDAGGTA